MSRAAAGALLLMLASEALGLALGQWFYGLFVSTVPPLAMSSFNMSTSHAAFLVYGALSGLAIGALALVAVYAARFFVSGEREAD